MSRWSAEAARAWSQSRPLILGCNFIPSSAINQIEMWQKESFDAETIARELGWAAKLGMNSVRIYLHDLVWDSDPDGFASRIDQVLSLADAAGIKVLLVIFDDCWKKTFALGPQPKPRIGVHNGGWIQSPGEAVVLAPEHWSRLQRFVTGLVSRFARDERVLAWDVYNEPGASGLGARSLPLLEKVFEWVRGESPTQPLTAGLWGDMPELNALQLQACDIISFHQYKDLSDLELQLQNLEQHERPLWCTEYLSRPAGCRFQTHLPVFKAKHIGAFNWGLVYGKTQTIYSWGLPEGSPEPEVWFHDILRPDGTPFDPAEAELLRSMTQPFPPVRPR